MLLQRPPIDKSFSKPYVFKLILHDLEAILFEDNPPSQLQRDQTTILNGIMHKLIT